MLYIRHGEKEYKNGGNLKFSLDPDLTEKGIIDSTEKFIYLASKYGAPDLIISSPYLRTRKTSSIAKAMILEITGINVEIKYDRILGECLKNQVGKDLTICLRPETLIHNPIPPENDRQYHGRMCAHVRNARSNIWYVTHGYNITKIALIKKQKIKYPDELCGIYIDLDDNISII